jgi:hypothetical protein
MIEILEKCSVCGDRRCADRFIPYKSLMFGKSSGFVDLLCRRCDTWVTKFLYQENEERFRKISRKYS